MAFVISYWQLRVSSGLPYRFRLNISIKPSGSSIFHSLLLLQEARRISGYNGDQSIEVTARLISILSQKINFLCSLLPRSFLSLSLFSSSSAKNSSIRLNSYPRALSINLELFSKKPWKSGVLMIDSASCLFNSATLISSISFSVWHLGQIFPSSLLLPCLSIVDPRLGILPEGCLEIQSKRLSASSQKLPKSSFSGIGLNAPGIGKSHWISLSYVSAFRIGAISISITKVETLRGKRVTDQLQFGYYYTCPADAID